jgi:hypothetical protein
MLRRERQGLAIRPALAFRGGDGGVPSLRQLASAFMPCSNCACSQQDPVALVESCQRALVWLLRNHQAQPLRRCWIDQPYGEEEITRLEQELLPAMEGFLERMDEIYRQLELAQQAEIQRAEAGGMPEEVAGAAAPLAA